MKNDEISHDEIETLRRKWREVMKEAQLHLDMLDVLARTQYELLAKPANHDGYLKSAADARCIEATTVSLQYTGVVPDGSRQERREHLQTVFAQLATTFADYGVLIDLDTISTSGHTVAAVIPTGVYNDIVVELTKTFSVRVDPIVSRQIATRESSP
jgi:hypothetical protein